MFELTKFVDTEVLDVRVLSKKDRKPGEDPGLQIMCRSLLAAHELVMFDADLPTTLFRKAQEKAQGELDGVESVELTSIGSHIGRVSWTYDQTGNTVTLDYGTGGRSQIVLQDCRVHRVSFQPQPNASTHVYWAIDAPALSDDTRGKVTGMKRTKIPLKQIGPSVADEPQQDLVPKNVPTPNPGVIDGSKGPGPWPFGANGEGNTPADGTGPADKGGSDSEGGETDVQAEPAKRGRSRARLAAVE